MMIGSMTLSLAIIWAVFMFLLSAVVQGMLDRPCRARCFDCGEVLPGDGELCEPCRQGRDGEAAYQGYREAARALTGRSEGRPVVRQLSTRPAGSEGVRGALAGVRAAAGARYGRTIVPVDYSQLELRWLARVRRRGS